MITITLQAETPVDSAPTFRLLINGAEVAADLTAEEAQLVVSKSVQRIARPRAGEEPRLPSPGQPAPREGRPRLPRATPIDLRGSAA